MNNLKVASSEMAPQIVHEALQIIGIAAYKNDSKFSVGRHYRDVAVGGAHDLERPHLRQDRVDAPRATRTTERMTVDRLRCVEASTTGSSSTGLIVPVRRAGRVRPRRRLRGRARALQRRSSRELAKDDGAEVYTFPPVIDRTILEKTDYLDSFPHLAGTVFSFFGKDKEAQGAVGEGPRAASRGATRMGMTDVVPQPGRLLPGLPDASPGTLPADGPLVTMTNWVYRHEPSPEPTRMQSFRVREFVRAGTPDMVVEWRDMWLAARPRRC